ncbi:MAG: hypothetical protein L0H24_11470 [Microlunatus sp.]|nr:hypothetical protein [Microlunatus sp.]
MILGLRYAPARFTEGRLLTATGAAEVLHRALAQAQPPIPADEFSAMRKTLLEHTPDQHRKWVREKLRNEVTLRERLRHLAGLPDSEAMGRLVPDVERWAAVTTQAGNDLTHEGHTRRQSIDEVIAAVKVTSAVMNLVRALESRDVADALVQADPTWPGQLTERPSGVHTNRPPLPGEVQPVDLRRPQRVVSFISVVGCGTIRTQAPAETHPW